MRIVSHTCSNTEILCALGLADQLVAVDDHSDYPAEVVRKLPRIGPDLTVDVDRILALNPDLVVTSLTLPGHEEGLERMQQAGLPLLVLEPKSLDDVPRDIQTIADALGVSQRGRELAEEFRTAMTPQQLDWQPAILVEWWPKPVIVPGQDSWVTAMIELAGGRNPWQHNPVKSEPVSDAEVLRARPDAVVISWCGVPFAKYRPEVVRRRESWAATPALRRDQVYCVSEEHLGRPGPRLLEGLKQLKHLVANVNQLGPSDH